MKPKKCYNCKHGGDQFKIVKMSYLHCGHPDIEIRNPIDKEDTGWDSLREFSSTCDHHEKKLIETINKNKDVRKKK